MISPPLEEPLPTDPVALTELVFEMRRRHAHLLAAFKDQWKEWRACQLELERLRLKPEPESTGGDADDPR